MSRFIKNVIKDVEQNYELDGSSIINVGGTSVPESLIDGHIPQQIDPTTGQLIDNTNPESNHTPINIPWTNRENAGTDGALPDAYNYTPVPPRDIDYPVVVRRKYVEPIVDYSASAIQEYKQNNAIPYAVFEDGTRRQVTWEEVFDPHKPAQTTSVNVAQIAAANNQNFWTDSNGAHVTNDLKSSWVEEYAEPNHGSLANPTLDNPWHNILLNSFGILLRRGLINLASLSRDSVAFYDGIGNEARNVLAVFGATGAQIGKDTENHLVLTNTGLSAYDGNGDLIPVNASNIEADHARIGELEVGKVDADYVSANYTKTTDLQATYATITDLDAAKGFVGSLKTIILSAINADIEHLTAGEIQATDIEALHAAVEELDAGTISTDSIEAIAGLFQVLSSNRITTDILQASYAEIDLANVNNAWIGNGVIKQGAIGDAQIQGVSANKLTAGEIDADNIIVRNLQAANLKVGRLNGQPVLGGYSYISPKTSGYSSKNPKTEKWYELSGTQYVLSTDTTVDADKKYYKADDYVALYDQDTIDGMFDNVNDRIDSAIETWTGTTVPTTSNYPASNWKTDAARQEHIGDIYYVVNTGNEADGYTYRYTYDNTQSSYKWTLIKDNQVTAALQRLIDAEGDISNLKEFQSETTTWQNETDEGITTIRENHSTLVSVVDKTIVETQQLWFAKANTTAPDKPTKQITSTSTAGNAWRVAVPAYNASYPNYYYCYQWKYADGTYGWSGVTRDIAMGESQSIARDAQTKANSVTDGLASYITSNDTAVANLNTKVDDIQVGGRNLLDSESVYAYSAAVGVLNKENYVTDGTAIFSRPNVKNDGFYLTNKTKQKPNTEYVVSFDIRETSATKVCNNVHIYTDLGKVIGCSTKQAKVYINGEYKGTDSIDINYDFTDGSFKKVEIYYKTGDPAYTTSNYNGIILQMYKGTAAAYTVELTNLKWEVGNKPTDWTPAPEDMATGNQLNVLQQSLQNQIDAQVDIWYYNAAPTLSNAPASDWSDNTTKDLHVGDLYFYTGKGYAYKFDKSGSTYSWVRIKDSDITSALSAAQGAQSTADNKRRIFTSTPTVPYDVGDLWVNGSVVKYASKARTSGSYTASEWTLTATDDTKADAAASAASTAQTTANNNIKSNIQLWFTKANTTAPTAPSAAVTSTATSGNVWTTVVPAYNASYPNYFYCYQYLKGDNSYAWSPVVYDRAMTETQAKSREAVQGLASKVDTTTFNTVVDEVNEQSSTITTLTTRIDNIKIGGRNLLRNTTAPAIGAAKDVVGTRSTVPETGVIRNTSTTSSSFTRWRSTYLPYSEYKNKTYTFSCDARLAPVSSDYTINSMFAYIGVSPYTSTSIFGSSTDRYKGVAFNNVLTDSWKRFYITIQVPNDLNTGTEEVLIDSNYLTVQFGAGASSLPIETRRWKLEEGTVATDWTPAPEDLASAAELTSTTTLVNQVKQTADNNKASITELTTTTSDLAEADSTISQRISDVEQDLSGFHTTVSETYATVSYVDDIQVGGRNYVLRGEVEKSTTRSSSNVFCSYSVSAAFKLLDDSIETFSISADVKVSEDASSSMKVDFYVRTSSGIASNSTTFTPTSSFKRYSYTVTRKSGISNSDIVYTYVRALAGTGTVTVKNIKLEIGNKPTDWSPAPEDMASGTDLTAEANKRKAQYATSSTAAGTAAKVATCSNFELYTGARISCTFTIANTAATPTLNVNGTGAKQIRSFSGAALTEAEYKWAANSTVNMVYDGTYWRMLDGGTISRLKTAETKIDQNSEAIVLRATKTEMNETVGAKNLSPYFSYDAYPNVSSTNSYWVGWRANTQASATTFTYMGDGWVRIQCTNTGTSTIRRDIYPVKCDEIKQGADYTWLIEFRNNNSLGPNNSTTSAAGYMYIVQSVNNQQFWGSTIKENIEGASPDTGLKLNTQVPYQSSVVYTKRFVKVAETSSDGHWNNTSLDAPHGLACFTFQTYANSTIDYEIRISVYEGRYLGPYKPYTGSQLYSTQAELKVANDAISSKVSTTDYTGAKVASLINQAADSVKIQAKHVEIDGTAIFNNTNFNNALTGALDGIQIGGRNLTKTTGMLSNPTSYGALNMYLSEPLVADETYIVQLWDVNVSHTGKTSDRLAVAIYYCGGSVNLYNFGNTNTVFTDGHADYLVGKFKMTAAWVTHKDVTNNAGTEFIRFYNSPPSADGTRNLTIGRVKLEVGNKPTDWSPAPEDSYTNGLAILWNATSISTANSGEVYICEYDNKTNTNVNNPGWVIFNGFKRTIPITYINLNSVVLRKTVWIVCRLDSATSYGPGTSSCVWYDSGWKYLVGGTDASKTTEIGDWTWVTDTDIVLGSFVMTASEAIADAHQYNPPLTYLQVTQGVTGHELAYNAQTTANAAAPKTSALKRSQRIYYRSNSSTKPSAPTAWVAEASANAYNAWSTKVAPISANKNEGTAKYLYLYSCEQRETVSGTFSCTTVQLDESTTVIDGGNVITHSIDATKISVDDLNALEATIGGFQIDSTSIHTKNVAVTSNADNSVALSSADFTRTVNDTSVAGLRFAIGDKFGVTGDGKLYAKNALLSGLTVGAFTSAEQNKILNDNLTLGGRNLLLKTNTSKSATVAADATTAYTGNYTRSAYLISIEKTFTTDTYLTFSFDWTITGNTSTTCAIRAYPYNVNVGTLTVGTEASGRYSKSIKMTQTMIDNITNNTNTARQRMYIYNTVAGAVFTVNNIKLEIGNKATDWTPAPEDVASDISAADTKADNAQTAAGNAQTTANNALSIANATIKSSVQLWFTKANTTAPTAPTAAITSTSTAGNAWRVVVPVHNASYPNYFYCYQYLKGDGTYSWSSVVLDNAMTEAQSTANGANSTANSAIKSSVQLWFTKANTTAPTAPTAAITSTSTAGNAWRIVVPTYNASYPYYYYCYQYLKGDGTYSWSSVVYDRAMTEAQERARTAITNAANAAKTATTYITDVNNDGIKIHAINNPNANYSLLNGDGMTIYNNGTQLAKFASTTVIGDTNSAYSQIDSTSFKVRKNNSGSFGLGYSTVSMKGNEVRERFYLKQATSNKLTIRTAYDIDSIRSIQVVGVDTYRQANSLITLTNSSAGCTITTIVNNSYYSYSEVTIDLTSSSSYNSSTSYALFTVDIRYYIYNTNLTMPSLYLGQILAYGPTCSTISGSSNSAESSVKYSSVYGTGNSLETDVSYISIVGSGNTLDQGVGESFISGNSNHIGSFSQDILIVGYGNETTTNIYGIGIFGEYNYAYSNVMHGIIAGSGNRMYSGRGQALIGTNLIGNNTGCIICGAYNKNNSGARLCVGNGSSESLRKNAFVVYNNGSAYINGSTSSDGTTVTSDKRVKELISNITKEESRDFISTLIPRKYYKTISGNKHKQVGFYAQDIENDPNFGDYLVTIDDSDNYDIEDFRLLNYQGIIAPLVGSVQDLQDRVDILEEENQNLRDTLQTLKQQNQDLESRLEKLEKLLLKDGDI